MVQTYWVIAAAVVLFCGFLYVMHVRERRPRKTQDADARADLTAAKELFNRCLDRLRKEALAYKLYDLTIQHGLGTRFHEQIFHSYGMELATPLLAYIDEFEAAGIPLVVVERMELDWLVDHGVTLGSTFAHRRQIVTAVLLEVTPRAESIIAGYQVSQ